MVGGPLAAFGAVGATQFGYAATCRAPDQPLPRRFAMLVGGSAALHLLAVASAPVRRLLRLSGNAPLALACTGISLAAPLYFAWRARTAYEINRRGVTSPSKETT